MDKVYPRVCGGTGPETPDVDRRAGLSPRVRGNPLLVGVALNRYRSIPACAGEPRWIMVCSRPRWVYPRVCGGTKTTGPTVLTATGLSPRVRGNLRRQHGNGPPQRSIPACAGEPAATPPPTRRRWVYPRVCGGTLGVKISDRAGKGLSPRVRGNLGGRPHV